MPEIQVRKALADKAKALDINVEKLIHDKLDPAPDPANPWKGATLLLCLVGFLLFIAGFNRPAPELELYRELADLNGKLTARNQKLTHEIGRLNQENKQLVADFQALAVGNREGITETWAKRIQRDVIAKGEINEQRGEKGKTLLIDAVKSGNLDRVRFLLDNGADPNVASFAVQNGKIMANSVGRTPLMWAIAYGHDHIIRCLVNDSRTDVALSNYFSTTALKMLHKQIEQQPDRAKKLREHIAAMGL